MGFWFVFFAVVGAFFLTALLMPKPQGENAKAAALGDFRFPRIDSGSPTPYIAGTVRVRGPNLVWYGDYSASPIKKKVKTGIFSSKKVTTGYKYFFGMQWALCLGPNAVVRRIWAGKNLLSEAVLDSDGAQTVIDKANILGGDELGRGGYQGTVTFYTGSFSQSPDPYLEAKIEPDMPGYRGFGYVVMNGLDEDSGFYVGNSTSIEPFEFEVTRIPDPLNLDSLGAAVINTYDANAANVIYEVITSTWGGMGYNPDSINDDSFRAVGVTLFNENHGISIKLEAAIEARDFIEQILQQIDGVLYEDPITKKITLALVRLDYDPDDLPILDETNVLEVTDFNRTMWSETKNQARVIYEDRDAEYNDRTAFAQDMSNFGFQGDVIRSGDFKYPNIKYASLANQIVGRELSYASVPFIKVRLVVNRIAATLKPASVFKLNWPDYGITNLILRVENYDLGDGKTNRIVLNAVQDRFAIANVIYAPPPNSGWTPPTDEPVDIDIADVREAPRFLLTLFPEDITDPDEGRVMAHAVAPTGMISYEVRAGANDADDDDYESVSETVSFPTTAVVETTYPADTDPLDTSVGLVIENVNLPGNLLNATDSEVRNEGANLIQIENEILAFQSVTDNMDGTYTLENVYRGLMDTVAEEHTAGARIFFLEGEHITSRVANVIETIDVKLLPVALTGAQLEMSDATKIDVPIVVRAVLPYPPAEVAFDSDTTPSGQLDATTGIPMTWKRRNRTATSLVTEADADQSPEAGQNTFITYGPTGTEFTDDLGNTTGATWNPQDNGVFIVHVYSRRSGLDSYTVRTYNFEVINAP